MQTPQGTHAGGARMIHLPHEPIAPAVAPLSSIEQTLEGTAAVFEARIAELDDPGDGGGGGAQPHGGDAR